MTEERKYINWLNHVPGVGKKKISVILSLGKQEPEMLYKMGTGQTVVHMTEICGFSYKVAENIADKIAVMKQKVTPDDLWNRLSKKQIKFLLPGDPEYPVRLREIPDAPMALYMKGDMDTAYKIAQGAHPVVAVIGARGCSEYGRYVAAQLGQKCAGYGIAVVSGLAAGVDGISQWSALQAKGAVAAVLGCGVDVCYPAGNRRIYDLLCRQGCIVSEYLPGTEPRATNFPPRNRIISGMADAVIVVEAKEKSGTLITVDMALEQGREVYIIPGRVTDAMSRGCNQLIRQGASVVCDLDETLTEIVQRVAAGTEISGRIHVLSETGGSRGTISSSEPETVSFVKFLENPYTPGSVRHEIYRVLDTEPKSVQAIYDALLEHMGDLGKLENAGTDVHANGIPDIRTLQTELLFMQMEGSVREAGGRFGVFL